MSKLEIGMLAENTQLSFENSRDNATFNSDQRDEWLMKGFEQKERLFNLVVMEMSTAPDPTVDDANTRLTRINKRLQDKQDSLRKFVDTIQQITDLVSILDIILG